MPREPAILDVADGVATFEVVELSLFQDQVDDSTVSEAGGVTIVTDPSAAAACEGAAVDYVETPAGAGFTVRGAASSAGCTCGAS